MYCRRQGRQQPAARNCLQPRGMAERAFEIMCRHANQREAHGSKLAEKQFVQETNMYRKAIKIKPDFGEVLIGCVVRHIIREFNIISHILLW